jgi:putative spermidine/putrescine transport system substrate-binding protein
MRLRAPAALAAAALMLAACGGNGSTSGGAKSLTVYSSGDVNVQDLYNKVIIPAFKKANPGVAVKFVFSVHSVQDTAMLSRLSASRQTKSDPPMDVVEGPTKAAALGKLLTPLTPAEVPAISKVEPALEQQVNNQALAYRASAVVLAYNSKTVPTPPATLNDVVAWVKAHPGKFTYCTPPSGGSGDNFVMTAVLANMDPAAAKTLTTTYDKSLESQWDKGFAVLKSLTPAVYQHQYPNGNQDVLNLLAKGTIWIAPVWSDQSLAAKRQGLLPDYIKVKQVTSPPFVGSSSYMGIPANSKHKDLAYKFLQTAMSVPVQTAVVSTLAGYPGIPMSELPANVQGAFGDLDTRSMSTGLILQAENDMKQAWQNKVP